MNFTWLGLKCARSAAASGVFGVQQILSTRHRRAAAAPAYLGTRSISVAGHATPAMNRGGLNDFIVTDGPLRLGLRPEDITRDLWATRLGT